MVATIGEQLRLAREERGIPLREISDQTRISVHYLEAIESNDYKRLPGGIFNRSFVRAYARYVGYDEKEAVEAYSRFMRDSGDSGEDVSSTPYHSKVYTDAPATRSPILTVVLAIIILGILTALALFVMHWLQRRSTAAQHEPSSHNEYLTGISAPPGLTWTDATLGNVPGSLYIWKTDYEQVLQ